MSGDDSNWWRGAVIYQIYPRSFLDTNGDGIGDLPGIADRLNYIAKLGVDGIWISPFFHSPMADFGYDVSDYRSVDPIFGNNEDFDIVLKQAHHLGLKIIIDMVLAHTSIEHPWFIESRLSEANRKADWYVWADAKPDGSPPNNWQSLFGGPAWTFDTKRGQYYLHKHHKHQPDLNFHNPQVREQVLSECRYWLERGVDGFRLDCIHCYYQDQNLTDNPPRGMGEKDFASQFDSLDPHNMQVHKYDKGCPEIFDFIPEIRKMMDEFPGTFTVSELGDDTSFEAAAKYISGDQNLHTVYLVHMMAGIRKVFTKDIIIDTVNNFYPERSDCWPSWSFTNHDVVRSVTRWGEIEGHDQKPEFAKTLNALLFCLRGTAFLYQGEELGLTEATVPFEKIQDPWGKFAWPEWQGRDGCRTPMPWHTDEHHVGFSAIEGDTWLPIPEWHRLNAVDVQKENPDSVLNFTKTFLNWRKTQPVLKTGEINFIETVSEKIVAFERTLDQEKIICFFNVSDQGADITYSEETDAPPDFCTGSHSDKNIHLPPFGMFITKIK